MCDIRLGEYDAYRTRWTVGRDLLDYFGDSTYPAALILDIKLIIKSVI